MVSLNVLGLNCGTSIDGIDVALCRIESAPSSVDIIVELLFYIEVPVTPALRSRILELTRPGANTTLEDVCDLNFALGEEFARAVLGSGADLDSVDIIASHGQTLWHTPQGARKSTLQMAESAVIAHATQKTVISDFRVAELAVGRQGAPLSGFFEGALLVHPTRNRISQNIGGIGNATVVPAIANKREAQEKNITTEGTSKGSRSTSNYLAFDTGPGNVLIDAAVRLLSNGQKHYDKDGEAGTRGEACIDHETVDKFLRSPYFIQPPPKTTGRELFSDDVARELVTKLQGKGISEDGIIATVTRITAESIARAYEEFVEPFLAENTTSAGIHEDRTSRLHEIYLCGGGAYNPNIVQHLQARLPSSKIATFDQVGFGIRAAEKEAVLFAVLGFLAVCGRSVPVAAMAENMNEQPVLGKITPGRNYHTVMWKALFGSEVVEKAPTATLGRIIMKPKQE